MSPFFDYRALRLRMRYWAITASAMEQTKMTEPTALMVGFSPERINSHILTGRVAWKPQTNHAMMNSKKAILSEFVSNPCRQDVEEIGKIIGVDFVLNAILNQDKKIVHVLAGDPYSVIQAG